MSKDIYTTVQLRKPKKSVLNLSYSNAFPVMFGRLYPHYVEDVVPGDVARVGNASLLRMNALSSPFMGSIKVTTHYFFCPYRILWRDWEDFITGGRLGTSKPPMPYISISSGVLAPGRSILDFLGYVRNTTSGFAVPKRLSNLLSYLAVWKIWNDYYRDQNLCPDIFPDPLFSGQSVLDDGLYLDGSSAVRTGDKFLTNTGIESWYDLPIRAWRKDLFTSALPFAQRGPSVTIPVGSSLVGYDVPPFVSDGVVPVTARRDAAGNIALTTGPEAADVGSLRTVPTLSEGINIEDLRTANALQRWLERNAIGGGRYVEQILSHFGIRVPDYRLDRPEFLGGNTYDILSSRVVQTSEDNTTPLGQLAGEGYGSSSMKPFTYAVREHGIILGFTSVMPDSVYSQGVARRNLKTDKLDYFFPEFENLGEQAIKNSEIFVSGSDSDNGDFGYGPRYYEYKDRINEVHGDFRTKLSYWVPQRIFGSLPGLNHDFVQVNPIKENSLNNIFAITDGSAEQMYFMVFNSARYIRPMSKWSKFNF